MATQIIKALDAKIAELERQLDALRSARSALGGDRTASPAGKAIGKAGRRRRRLTAAEKKAISIRMKALWAKRRTVKK